MSNGTANFVGNCGECHSPGPYYTASCSGGMQLGQSATVNGGPPQNCVIANGNAMVFQILFQPDTGIVNNYKININAQGPSGFASGSMYLAFQDSMTGLYYLNVFDSSPKWHEITFFRPYKDITINAIFWSNVYFIVPSVDNGDPNREKTKYKIVSPVD